MITLEMLFLLRNVRPLLPPQAGRETRAGHCHLAQNATSMKTLLNMLQTLAILNNLKTFLNNEQPKDPMDKVRIHNPRQTDRQTDQTDQTDEIDIQKTSSRKLEHGKNMKEQ